jgi:glycine cleavage system H protein
MEQIFYSREHFWVSIEGDIATVGLTEFILGGFSMIAEVNLPQISIVCNSTELVGNVIYDEDKIFEIFSPFSGEIVEINELLLDSPEQLMSSLKENNWLFKIFVNNADEFEELISEEEYNEYIDEI